MSAKWTFWAWEQPIKTAPKKLALLQLANNANDDGKSWYSILKMAIACGVSERTFQRQVQSLESDGLLHVERRINRPSIYMLKDDIEIVLHDNLGCQSVTPGCQSVTTRGVRVSPDLNSDPNTHPNNKYIDQSKIERCKLEDDSFEYWWSHYPKKVGRKATKAIWKSLIKKMDDGKIRDLTNHICDDVKFRINDLESGSKKYIGFNSLHPERYLKYERYNDEL